MVTIRAFRAIDDPAGCERFITGHKRVLEAHGVKKVTSSNNEWAENPSVFVVNVESEDKSKVYGGARIHASDCVNALPIEMATGYLDNRIYERVHQLRPNGTGELCGLWNSMEVAGMGIGSFFATRAATAIADQLGLTSLWGLCAPFTVRWAERLGSRIQYDIGNKGTFYYPKLDLVATVVLLEDSISLETVRPYEREQMFDLRANPIQIKLEAPPGKRNQVDIKYELSIDSANPEEFIFKPNLVRKPYLFEKVLDTHHLPEF